MGFSGSPMSSVKRKMYFSTELGFVACVCYGNSAVAKFKVKSSVFYFLNKDYQQVLHMCFPFPWGSAGDVFHHLMKQSVFKASELCSSLSTSSSTIAYQCTNMWTCFCSLMWSE